MNQRARLDPRRSLSSTLQRSGDASGGRSTRRLARPRPLPVHPRAGGAHARSRARRVLRRASCRELCQRNRRIAAGADGQGNRAGRRRDLPELHLHRHRRGRGAGRGDAGLCRRRGGELQSRPRKSASAPVPRRASSGSPQSGDPGRPVRATRGLSIASRRSPRPRACSCSTMRPRPSGRPTTNRRVGALAPATATSFFPAKPLGCYGDGGAVLTDDDELAHVMRSLRVHGEGRDKYDCVRIGLNGRLDTIQAAVLIEKLKIFPEEIAARERIARRYSSGLADVATVPMLARGSSSVWAQYTIRLAPGRRDGLAAALAAQGIPDCDLLSDTAAPSETVPALSRRRRRCTGERTARRGGDQPAHACLSRRQRRRTGSSRRYGERWVAEEKVNGRPQSTGARALSDARVRFEPILMFGSGPRYGHRR